MTKLLRGTRCVLKCEHKYPMTMSCQGGMPSRQILTIEEGTPVIVTKDSEGGKFSDIPFRLVEEDKNRHGTFFTPRLFLKVEGETAEGQS